MTIPTWLLRLPDEIAFATDVTFQRNGRTLHHKLSLKERTALAEIIRRGMK